MYNINMKILTHNINGIRSILKKDNIVNNINKHTNTYINFIKREDPDIICFNELKISKKDYELEYIINNFEKYNYKCINFSYEKNGYAGVSIFSKIKPLSSCIDIGDTSTGRYVIMEFDKFILVCVYVMNSGQNLKNISKRNDWDKLFLKKIKEIKKKYKKELILTGDFNVINREVDTHSFTKQHNKLAGVSDIEMSNFKKLLSETKLIDSWLELNKNKVKYSYFTYRYNSRKSNNGMRIDYFLISKKLLKNVKRIEMLDNIYGSDHLPILLDIKI